MPSHNSTMVRFKQEQKLKARVRRLRSQFHYGSIQTKAPYMKMVSIVSVTIPLWFDSNQRSRKDLAKSIQRSQFHYGSIQTGGGLMSLPYIHPCHNSTMVRFKLDRARAVTTLRRMVTIPLWFDSNTGSSDCWSDPFGRSQFHYGSIQTRPALLF